MRVGRIQKQIVQMIAALICVIAASIFRAIRTENLYWSVALFLLVYVLYVSIDIIWLQSLHRRIMQKKIRHYLCGTAILICFWLLLRSIRFGLLWDGMIRRYAWYGYYIPMILIPLFGFYTALYMGKREDYDLPIRWKLLWIPAVLLILGILTNEFHQLAFRIHRESPEQYSRGIFYLCAAIWIGVLESSAILILLKKSLILNIGREKIIPFIVLGVSGVYYLLYAINSEIFGFVELTAAFALSHACIWESCIAIGVFPVNTNYESLFQYSRLKMLIIDQKGKIYYHSMHHTLNISDYLEEITQGQMILLDTDTELHSVPIQGGYIVWQEDITEINEIIREKQEMERVLREQTELMQQEYEMDSRRIRIQKMNQIYQLVAEETRGTCDKILLGIEELKAGKDNEDQRKQLLRINLEGVYVKRRCNLLMIWESMGQIPVEELHFCFEESLDNLEICEMKASLSMQLQGSLNKETAVLLYDILEQVIEQILFIADRLYVILTEDPHQIIKLSIFIHSYEKIKDVRMPGTLDQLLQKQKVAYFFKKEEKTEYLFSARLPGEVR